MNKLLEKYMKYTEKSNILSIIMPLLRINNKFNATKTKAMHTTAITKFIP
jgi:hypothetical protein